MAEFYVTYRHDEHPFLAVIVARDRPAVLRFDSREVLLEAMESLGCEWQMTSEVQLPGDYPEISETWLESVAEQRRLRQLPKACGSRLNSDGAAMPT